MQATRLLSMVALTTLVGGGLACVVEKEPGPPKRLLRDTLSAKVQPSAPPAPAPPAPPPPLVQAPVVPDAAPPPAAPPADPVVVAAPPVSAADPGAAPTIPPPVPDAFRTCQTDSDCVAVLRNGCCRNGLHEAMNQASVEAYKASFTCPTRHPICPMHLVLDRRVPACTAATHQCAMVDQP
jgi:hypothetical protein